MTASKRMIEAYIETIDENLGHLADAGHVDEVWAIRALLDSLFPLDIEQANHDVNKEGQ